MRTLPSNPMILLAFSLSTAAVAGEPRSVEEFLQRLGSADKDVRNAARSEVIEVGAAAVAPLAALIEDPEPGAPDDRQRREVAIGARAALERLVHHAGRDGSGAARTEVAAALSSALAGAKSPKAKREVAHLIAFIGADAEAPAVGKLLDDADKHVRETARLSLERIPGNASTEALIAAVRKADPERKPDLLFSLSRKPAAAPFLLETARSSEGKVRASAFQALAHLGDPAAGPALEKLLEDPSVSERAQLFLEYLRWADQIAAKASPGNPGSAQGAYLFALKSSPVDHQRERALRGAAAGGPLAMEALLLGLADSSERVRRVALSRFLALDDPGAAAALRKAYDEGRPETRPSLLRALAQKDRDAAGPLIREASSAGDPDLRITALDILGALDSADMEEAYLKAARSGGSVVREPALKGWLLRAKRRLESGEKDRSHAMYASALEVATASGQRSEALAGVIAAGGTKAIDTVAGLVKDPVLGADASKSLVDLAVKLGAEGDKDRADRVLTGIVKGEFPPAMKTRAVEELRRLGRDPQDLLRGQGYIIDWWLIGPMADRDGKGLEEVYFPEEVIDLENEQRIGPRRFRWKKPGGISLDGRIQLVPEFRRSDRMVAYAYAEVFAPEAGDAVFKMGSDDGIACFLNKKRVHLQKGTRSLTPDQDSVPVKLEKGKNQVLLKISNDSGDWGFAFRITDPAGKPFEPAPPQRDL